MIQEIVRLKADRDFTAEAKQMYLPTSDSLDEVLEGHDYTTFGWGNGYVTIPKWHRWFGKPAEWVEQKIGATVGAEISISTPKGDTEWIFGFDTCKTGMSDVWTKEQVVAATERLRDCIQGWEDYDTTEELEEVERKRREKEELERLANEALEGLEATQDVNPNTPTSNEK